MNQTNGLRLSTPVVEIAPDALARLQLYADLCPVEISGFGTIRVVDGALIVEEVFIAPQRCTAARTEIAADDLAAFLDELLERGVDPGQLHLYWHSHANMDVFFSPVDNDTLSSTFTQAGWMLALVLNRRGEMKTCLQLYHPIRLCLQELPVRLHLPDSELRESIHAEVAQKVRMAPMEWDTAQTGAAAQAPVGGQPHAVISVPGEQPSWLPNLDPVWMANRAASNSDRP